MHADLSTAQLEKLRKVFDEALQLAPDQRGRFLSETCGDDDVLRNEAESLLGAFDRSDGFFEALADEVVRPAFEVAASTRANELHPDASDRDVLRLAGRTIGHFHVQEPLASGGMGVVYRATDTHLGRPVALKFPLPGARLEHRTRDRFLREARAASALDHPNICSVYEAGETENGQLFLAMPLYAGETLKARLERKGRLPISEVLTIAEQISRGLQAAADAGIVHRDLKPANVMILPDATVKLLDFGIATVSDINLTASRGTLGTVPYMAPEQVLGDDIDSRADLWALGVVLYEMLTGERPFGGRHQIAVAHSIAHSEPARPSTLRPDIPAKLEDLVLRLLAKQRELRPASAEAVANDLGAARSDSVAQRKGSLQRSAFRLPRRLFARGATAVAIVTAGALTWWQLQGKAASAIREPRTVAVLPFQEVGANDSDAYLGAGLTAEILTALSRLQSVTVPSESPVGNASAGGDSPSRLARKMGAAGVVSGRVQRTGNDVRLQLSLFDSAQERSIWTREYTGSAGNVLSLQRNAIEGIADALDLDISRAERVMMMHVPTESKAAYHLYLRGLAAELRARPGGPSRTQSASATAEPLQIAESYFARARETDRDFGEARAHLALTQLALARDDRTSTRREQARLEAEAALRLRPGMSEGHEALARYWALRGSRANAATEAERALAGRPNASHLHILLATNLRELGRWEESLAALERATRLDPLSRTAPRQAAVTYSRIRRYKEAITHMDRVIAMDSGRDPFPQIIRGYIYLRLGSVDSLDAAIARLPLAPDAGGMTTYARYIAHRIKGRNSQLLAVLDSARFPISSDSLTWMPVTLMRAQTLDNMGDAARARANYEAAQSMLEDTVAAHPRDARMRVALGLAYAGLQRRADAIREARTATEIVPLRESSPTATAFMGGAAEIYARLGEAEEALDLIEMLLAMPAGREISVPLLRIDPVYNRLRTDPRFDALLGRFSQD